MTHATALKAGFDAFRSAVRLVRETLGGDDKTRTAAPPGAAPAAPNLHAQLQALQQSPRVGEPLRTGPHATRVPSAPAWRAHIIRRHRLVNQGHVAALDLLQLPRPVLVVAHAHQDKSSLGTGLLIVTTPKTN
jgi:hypothetical protein